MELCLSTSWNAFRYTDGKKVIAEVQRLGFRAVELSFNLTKGMVEDIAFLVKKKQIEVNSLHNFCPIPEGVERESGLPDCYSVASLDEHERALAVKYTKVSIDSARDVNAKAVVMHCGRVEIADRTRELISIFYSSEGASDPRLKSITELMRREREEKARAHLEAVYKSLDELSPYAQKQQVALGIENRYYFREIPSFEETARLLEHCKGAPVFYWHDTGHAQLWENLGFRKHQEYLDRYGASLIGVHLHDIIKDDDHLAPLRGDFDFKLLAPYLTKDTIKTLEAHYPASSQDIIKAKDFLETLYGEH